MKVAVVGSRNITLSDLQPYLPPDTSEIISGGAKGIDTCARLYAESRHIPITEIRPQYTRYGRAAPLIRNRDIVLSAEHVVAIWDGCSKGTAHVIRLCRQLGKSVTVYTLPR